MSGARGAALDALLERVARAARDAGFPAYLVGGALRDQLLGRPSSRDVDVAVEAGPARLGGFLEALAGAGLAVRARHDRFGTATFESPDGLRLDVASTRRETYPGPAALPVVTTGVPIAEDLARRDFTVHAMARGLAPGAPLLDPFGGERDLAERRLRLLHDASLVDDPTRIFRAARYAARLGFRPADEFAAQLRAAREAGALAALSPDRLRRALGEILEDDGAAGALGLVHDWGVLQEIAPGLAGRELPAVAPEGASPWSPLFAPLSAEAREALAVRLNFSRALRRGVGLRA